MSTFEDLFDNSVLSVIAPKCSLGPPPQGDQDAADQWLESVEDGDVDRKLAFFDENLSFLLLLRIGLNKLEDESDPDPTKPPATLLSYLTHLQISYDASYIAPMPEPPPAPTPEPSGPPVPPRTVSVQRNKPNALLPVHPSIFPPSTPNPVPSTTDSDRQYVQAQGTPLRVGNWGEGSSDSQDPDKESFALLWSTKDRTWVAVYKMTIQVSFMMIKVPDPLLCLTVSTTLREKPLAVTPPRRAIMALLEAAGEVPAKKEPVTPVIKVNGEDDDESLGLEEVNLFDGLALDPTFASEPLNLPSSRLGASIRKKAFSLPPATPATKSPTSSASTQTMHRAGMSHATLRKSFRKTLRTVSGIGVRMRTVFVPYFMLPQTGPRKTNGYNRESADKHEDATDEGYDDEGEEALNERELREAGNEEHTVILCVEVVNGGESSVGYAVESVNVTVSGEGAQTRLIGWGERGMEEAEKVFPLFLSSHEQCNLLYVVSFLRSPETDEFSLARGRGLPGAPDLQDLQRAVTIIINGRPYEVQIEEGQIAASKAAPKSYPTPTFPSRWNCTLTLSPQRNNQDESSEEDPSKNVLPTPASPFPASIKYTSPTGRPSSTPNFSSLLTPRAPTTRSPGQLSPSGGNNLQAAVAGNKRYTFSAMDAEMASASDSTRRPRSMMSPVNYKSGTAMLNPTNQRDPSLQSGAQASPINPILSATAARASYVPPSVTVQQYTQPTTTYSPISPPLPPVPNMQSFSALGPRASPSHGQEDSISSVTSFELQVPPTPAYPAYPTSPPPTNQRYQNPIANLQSGSVGPSVEIRREKGTIPGVPPTPGPRIGTEVGFGHIPIPENDRTAKAGDQDEGEPIIVSVGLLPVRNGRYGTGKIFPLDQFTLDIFVFNQSSWTRRFEVSYPDRRKRRREQVQQIAGGNSLEVAGKAVDIVKAAKDASLGIVPLENRIRIGPLLPSTCQSVRMDFLAITPGVHSVEVLTLTDVQTGYSMNLRSVLDVVVHEHEVD
ncbi:hypothetical protein K474DRAFT_1647966 [Panus rudis PR-1116 ss-1]|nr:hypothetical protein K474DRAFT_1647966 [Panus rudis PR-1116 ss-1]